jgi:GntR family transcriptional regulator/MocR family aminotransferase
MAKAVSSFELSLNDRQHGQSLGDWLYQELRMAIVSGRLKPGTRLPASREFAKRHGLSRGIIVSVFERLQADGYVSSRIGSGTWINDRATGFRPRDPVHSKTPHYIERAKSDLKRPKPFVDWVSLDTHQPFRMRNPALAEFPADVWGRIAAKRARRFRSWLHEEEDRKGFKPLREAIAHYLASSRGVRCGPDQVLIVSGVQQALDILARLLLKPGDPVWMEDPGYFGASIAFDRVGAKIIPVPVDGQGLSVSEGIKLCETARGVFLTPAHQYPMGMTMSPGRRREVLDWASRNGSFIIEDDYDSEYRFDERPVPALQGLDEHGSVIFLGTFTKLLFPSLRLGYVVLPQGLVDAFMSTRLVTDLHTLELDQVILCDFITGGHFGRHLRRMREIYAARLDSLMAGGRRHLHGLARISDVRAGLYTVAFLQNGMTSHEAEAAAAAHNVETRSLDRFTLQRPDPRGLLLGFAAFDEATIQRGLIRLAEALENEHQTKRAGPTQAL